MNDHHFSYITILKKETLILRSTYLTNLKKKTLWSGASERKRRKKKVSKREATAQTDLEERKKKQARKTSHWQRTSCIRFRTRALALHTKPDTPASSISEYRIPTPSSLESKNLFSGKLKYSSSCTKNQTVLKWSAAVVVATHQDLSCPVLKLN